MFRRAPLSSLKASKRSKVKQLTCIVTVFILSRLFYYSVGIRFDATPLAHFWQYIDINLLGNNLLQSLYYLHSQPPLFNLFLGVSLKFFANHLVMAFTFSYLLLGLIFSVSLYLLMTTLGMSERLSIVLTILYIISPTVILYENLLFYTYPIAVILCLSAIVLHKYLATRNVKMGLLFFALLSIIALTISMFHLLWFVLFFIILLFYERHHWKKIALACCIPLALILFLYLKNLYVFGSFTSSSWFGMNFSRMTILNLPEQEKVSLVRQGKISTLSLIPPFSDFENYQAHTSGSKRTNIAVLDQKRKTGGGTNFNNIAYVNISKQYLKNAVYILRFRPEAYIKGLMISYWNYFRPATNWRFLKNNREKILLLDNFYNLVLCGQILRNNNLKFEAYNTTESNHNFFSMGLHLLIGYPLLVFYGFLLIRKTLANEPIDRPFTLTMLFILINRVFRLCCA